MYPFQRILCAVDFSRPSLLAFSHAVQLARLGAGQIHVLHVIPRIVTSPDGRPVRTSPWTREEETNTRRALEKLAATAARSGVTVTTEMRIGDVDFEILLTIRDTRADLLVMGTHGRRAFQRWILGSVAESLMRCSPVPLLTVGLAGNSKPQAREIRRILVATDFSKNVSDRVSPALEIARLTQASVTLLHVIEPEAIPAGRGRKPSKAHVERIYRRLDSLIPGRLRSTSSVVTRVETGRPSRRILQIIESSQPDLVVLGTHGGGFIERVLVGSTAERVVRGASAISPILLMPPRRKSKGR